MYRSVEATVYNAVHVESKVKRANPTRSSVLAVIKAKNENVKIAVLKPSRTLRVGCSKKCQQQSSTHKHIQAC